MRLDSRIPIVLMATMLPLLAAGRDVASAQPLWRSAHQSARLGDSSRREITVVRPAERATAPAGALRPRVWQPSSQTVTVQRSRRSLAGLARLFSSGDRRRPAVVQPSVATRLQQKGRLP